MRFRLLLCALTAAAYAPVIATPWFLSARAEVNEPALRAARPLAALSYSFIDGALASHALQVGLHLSCVLLAARLFEDLLVPRAARIAAALFALHPLQTEAVCSLSARPVLLAACLSLLAWECCRRDRPWLGVVVFAAAPLAHEQAALLPLALLLWRAAPKRALAAMSAFSLLAFFRAPRPPLDLPLTGQLGVAALRDLWLVLLPVGLTPAPELRAQPWAAALAWGAVAAVAAIAAASFRKTVPARWLLSGLALVLPAGFLAPAAEAGSDRLMYLPLIAFAGLVGWAFASADSRALAAVGGLFALITVSQVLLWRNERAVWTEAVRLAPRSPLPRIRLAAVSDPDVARTLLDEARGLQ